MFGQMLFNSSVILPVLIHFLEGFLGKLTFGLYTDRMCSNQLLLILAHFLTPAAPPTFWTNPINRC